MGKKFADKFSYLHFAVGIISYYWAVDLKTLLIVHTIFELLENSPYGIKFINTQLKGIWPGGKDYKDSIINNLGDTVFVVLGWLSAHLLQILLENNFT